MTETICPTCGSRCTIEPGPYIKGQLCNCGKHSVLKPIPQPDLTKLRELDRKYSHIVAICQLSQKGWDLIRQAVKNCWRVTSDNRN